MLPTVCHVCTTVAAKDVMMHSFPGLEVQFDTCNINNNEYLWYIKNTHLQLGSSNCTIWLNVINTGASSHKNQSKKPPHIHPSSFNSVLSDMLLKLSFPPPSENLYFFDKQLLQSTQSNQLVLCACAHPHSLQNWLQMRKQSSKSGRVTFPFETTFLHFIKIVCKQEYQNQKRAIYLFSYGKGHNEQPASSTQ